MGHANGRVRSIVLIGHRGSGKSTVGRLLADRLGCGHVDTEELIQAKSRRTIAEIFERDGEKHVRTLESEVIAALPEADRVVISVGGGAVLDERNCKRLSELGHVVYLAAAAEELHRRVTLDRGSCDSRPPLTTDDALTEIRNTLADRMGCYRKLAQTHIDTAGLSPEAVAGRIVERLQS